MIEISKHFSCHANEGSICELNYQRFQYQKDCCTMLNKITER
jgi:hypothetical protein